MTAFLLGSYAAGLILRLAPVGSSRFTTERLCEPLRPNVPDEVLGMPRRWRRVRVATMAANLKKDGGDELAEHERVGAIGEGDTPRPLLWDRVRRRIEESGMPEDLESISPLVKVHSCQHSHLPCPGTTAAPCIMSETPARTMGNSVTSLYSPAPLHTPAHLYY
jgi:hypothetical protein